LGLAFPVVAPLPLALEVGEPQAATYIRGGAGEDYRTVMVPVVRPRRRAMAMTREPWMVNWQPDEVAPGDDGGVRRLAALLAEAASAPTALVTLFGILFIVFVTKPVRPYAGGEWAPGDLMMLVMIGVLAGFPGRGLQGFAGIVLGMTGAVALQLFVLTSQASWIPQVATTLPQSSWMTTVAASLGLGLAATTGGYVLTRAAWIVLAPRRRDQVPPSERSPWRFALPIGVAVIGILVTGLLLLDASASAYVPSVAARRASGDAGPVQVVGGLVAVMIAGWAAAGTVIAARQPRRSTGGALIVGLATAALLECVALFAIDLAHNPF
jgi:hypothetical protein